MVIIVRIDVITVAGSGADHLDTLIAEIPGATDAVSKHRPDKHHWAFPNGGRVRVFSTAEHSPAGVTLNSDLDDAAHNGWAIEVFNALCASAEGDVTLLDENDKFVRSRPTHAEVAGP